MKQKVFGLVLNEGERDELLQLCLSEGIPITFPELFKGPHRYLWSFGANGIGGAGTDVMRAFKSCGVRIIHGVNELKDFFKTNEWKECKNNA